MFRLCDDFYKIDFFEVVYFNRNFSFVIDCIMFFVFVYNIKILFMSVYRILFFDVLYFVFYFLFINDIFLVRFKNCYIFLVILIFNSK